jgi:hypothetical protein
MHNNAAMYTCTSRLSADNSHTASVAAAGIEHRGPVLDLVPLGDYTARGVYMAKAWKVGTLPGWAAVASALAAC